MERVCQGWLWKRGGGNPSVAYRKRWCELRHDKYERLNAAGVPQNTFELAYYRKPTDHFPAGIISFSNSYYVYPTDIHLRHKRFCFVLSPTDEVKYVKTQTARVYYLYAETKEAMLEWLESLQIVINGPASASIPRPLDSLNDIIKAGLLLKRGPDELPGVWRNRWVVLRHGPMESWCRSADGCPFTLSYYAKVEDTEPVGMIYLSDQYVVRFESSSQQQSNQFKQKNLHTEKDDEEEPKRGSALPNNTSSKKETAKFLLTPLDNQISYTRTFHFAARTLQDAEEWIESLQQAIEKSALPATTQPLSGLKMESIAKTIRQSRPFSIAIPDTSKPVSEVDQVISTPSGDHCTEEEATTNDDDNDEQEIGIDDASVAKAKPQSTQEAEQESNLHEDHPLAIKNALYGPPEGARPLSIHLKNAAPFDNSKLTDAGATNIVSADSVTINSEPDNGEASKLRIDTLSHQSAADNQEAEPPSPLIFNAGNDLVIEVDEVAQIIRLFVSDPKSNWKVETLSRA